MLASVYQMRYIQRKRANMNNYFNEAIDICYDIIMCDSEWDIHLDHEMSMVFLEDLYEHYLILEDYDKLSYLKQLKDTFTMKE